MGALFVVLGWYGAAHTNIVSEQIPYLISGGLLGLGLIIVSGFMAYAFMIEQQNEALRDEVRRALSGGARAPITTTPDAVARAPRPVAAVLAVPGGRAFHLPGCPIVENKNGVRELTPAQAASAGLSPCKLCSDE